MEMLLLCLFILECYVTGEDVLKNFNGTERVYYISADIKEFDYVPGQTNACNGEPFDDDTASLDCFLHLYSLS